MINTKKDKSVHNICIASIKRHTMKPYNFKWTKFYETKLEFENSYHGLIDSFETEELPICSTVIDSANWSVLTTRRLITNENNIIVEGNIQVAKYKWSGDFKGGRGGKTTFGIIEFEDGIEMKYYIETGKASMVMIYGLRTGISLISKFDEEKKLIIKSWTKRGLMK